MWQVVHNILVGAGSGALAALLGYCKNANLETFDVKKFMQTVIVGAICGGCATYWGVTLDKAYEILSTTGALTLTEYVKKTICRRLGWNV